VLVSLSTVSLEKLLFSRRAVFVSFPRPRRGRMKSLKDGKAERVGAVQPGEEKAAGRP